MRQDGGSIVYEAIIDSSKIKSGLSNAESQMANSGDKAAKGYGAKFGAIAGITAAVTNKAMSMVSNSIDKAVSRVDTSNNAPKVLQNLGFGAEESTKAIDVMSKGIEGLPTSLDSAASALVRITAASGKGIEEATALTLAFNNMALSGGKGPQEAERAMVQYTQALSRGRFEGEEFNTMMEVMPAQMTQVAKSLLGPTATAGELKEAMSKGTVTMDQFNNEIVRLDKEGGDGFASFSKQAKDATGGIGTGMANMQTAVARGLAGIIESIGSANIVSAISAIGKAFETALGFIAATIKFIIDNKDVFIPLGIAIGVVAGFMAAYNAALAIHAGVMAVVTAAVNTWQAIIKIATAVQWLWNAAMSANPIGLIIIAIAAVTAALIWFFTQTDLGREIIKGAVDFMANAWEWLVGVFKAAWEAVKNVWSAVVGFFKGVWDGIVAIFSAVVGFYSGIFSGAWNAIKAIWSAVIGWFKGIWDGIVAVFSGVISFYVGIYSGAWNGIKAIWSAVTGWFGNVWQGIKNIFSAVSGWFGNIFTGAWNAIKNAFSSVTSFFTGVWDTVKSIFTGAGTAIGNAISGAFKGAVNGAFSTVENGINSAIGLIDKVTPGSIGRVSLPRLAKGGIVDSPTTAIIGEAGEEAVLPLENNTEWMDELASKIGGGGGPTTIVVKLGEETIATRVIDLINDRTRLSGNNSIMV